MTSTAVVPSGSSPAIGAYIRWLKANQPYFYKEVLKKFPQAAQLNGMGLTAPADSGVAIDTDRSDSAVTASWTDTLKNIITAASQIYLTKEQVDSQKRLTDIQLTRVQQGLAPLNIDPTTLGLPGPTVSFGMSPATQKLVTWGAIGAGALFVLAQVFGHHRRRHS